MQLKTKTWSWWFILYIFSPIVIGFLDYALHKNAGSKKYLESKIYYVFSSLKGLCKFFTQIYLYFLHYHTGKLNKIITTIYTWFVGQLSIISMSMFFYVCQKINVQMIIICPWLTNTSLTPWAKIDWNQVQFVRHNKEIENNFWNERQTRAIFIFSCTLKINSVFIKIWIQKASIKSMNFTILVWVTINVHFVKINFFLKWVQFLFLRNRRILQRKFTIIKKLHIFKYNNINE